MTKMHLAWRRDRLKRYRIKEIAAGRAPGPKGFAEATRRPPQAPAGTIFHPLVPGTWIVLEDAAGELESYNPFDVELIYRTLASKRDTPEGALEFVLDFGFLRQGQSALAAEIQREVRRARKILAAVDNKDWPTLGAAIKGRDTDMLMVPTLAPSVEGIEVWYRPNDLLGAIYLQLFEDMALGVPWRERCGWRSCERRDCGKLFRWGPGFNHRKTAQYCCKRCENIDSYRRRKEETP